MAANANPLEWSELLPLAEVLDKPIWPILFVRLVRAHDAKRDDMVGFSYAAVTALVPVIVKQRPSIFCDRRRRTTALNIIQTI